MQNEILTALPAADLEHLHPHLRSVTLVPNQVLYEAGAPIDYIYFPEKGLVSLTMDTGDKGLVDAAVIGHDGVVGAPVLLSPHAISVFHTLVQIPGNALRIQVNAFRDAVSELPTLRDRCLRSLYVTLVQASQIAACNARHELFRRSASRLLAVRASVGDDEMLVTQDFLACMLGVHRPGVSVVVSRLRSLGLIRQGRGRITILDRAGLEANACNCYRLIEDARQQIMSNCA